MNDLAKRVVVAVVVFFLVAMAYTMFMRAQAFAEENDRLTEVNLAIADTTQIWRDSTAVLDTALVQALSRGDSLAQQTGPIRWHTRTVRVGGRVDTLRIATIRVDTVEVEIPQVVAEEIIACRTLIQDCENFRETADSTIKWQATHIDTLQKQIDHLSQQFDVPQLKFLGLKLPLPNLAVGYGVLYSVGQDCSNSDTEITGDFNVTIDTDCQRIHHGPVLSASWPIKLW